MKITLTKHGGLAAGIRRPPCIVDASKLPAHAAAELRRLVDAAKAAHPQKEAHPGSARDAMSYALTIEDDGRSTELRQSDVTLSEPLAALITWLEDHAPKP